MRRAYTWLKRSQREGTEDIERFMFLWISFKRCLRRRVGAAGVRRRRRTKGDRARPFPGLPPAYRGSGQDRRSRDDRPGTSFPVRSGFCCRTGMCTAPSGWLCGALSVAPTGDTASIPARGWRWRPWRTATSRPCCRLCSTGSIPCATRYSTAARRTPVAAAGTRFRDGSRIMASLVPAILDLMQQDIDNNRDSERWGKVAFPRINTEQQEGL